MVARVAESADTTAWFEAKLDAKCQRGLHWRYTLVGLEPPGDASADASMHARLTAEPRIVHRAESWGEHTLNRYVLPFRFELRIWTRPGELSFIHRQTASADQREQDRAAFERLLTAWCQQHGAAGT
mgnify:CR=1 FL=1